MTDRNLPDRLGGAAGWKAVAVLAALLALTAGVGFVYTLRPQSPRDLTDRLSIQLGVNVHAASVRVGDRWLSRSRRADAVGADSLAETFAWRATDALARAARTASGAQEELAANDRLAEAYLLLGWKHLERGRGGRFGIGRRPESLQEAEEIGRCVVGIAPTRLRAEINVFVEELEAVLERRLQGYCTR